MKEVIRLFNEEELDAPRLNMLRRRVQIDFIMTEDRQNPNAVIINNLQESSANKKGKTTKRGEEIEVKRFLKIYKDVIKDQLSGTTL